MDYIIFLVKYLRLCDHIQAWYIGTCDYEKWSNGYIGSSCLAKGEGHGYINGQGYCINEGWKVISQEIICYCTEDEHDFYEGYYIDYFCERYGVADIPEMRCRMNSFCQKFYQKGGVMINQQSWLIDCHKGLTKGTCDWRDSGMFSEKANSKRRVSNKMFVDNLTSSQRSKLFTSNPIKREWLLDGEGPFSISLDFPENVRGYWRTHNKPDDFWYKNHFYSRIVNDPNYIRVTDTTVRSYKCTK